MSNKSEHLRRLIAKYSMRTGEELKRGLPSVVREAYSTGCWRESKRIDGTSFDSFAEWLTTNPPPGCGLGCTDDAITYDELLEITEKLAPDVAKILASERPNGRPGRPGKNRTARYDLFANARTHRPTLAARLQREKPSFYQAYLDGKYRSIRSAAEKAGIVKPGHDALMRLRSYWNKATKAQRKQFLLWTKRQMCVSK